MVYVDALARVVPVLLLFVLGALLRRRSVIRPETVDDLRSIVLKLALPSALFLTFLRVSLEARYLWIVVSVFGACVVVLVAGRWIGRAIGVTSPLLPALLTGFEAGMLGYAIFGATFGSAELYRFAIVDIGQVMFVFFVLATVLARGSTGEMPSLRATGLSFIRTPVILGIAGGIIGSLVGLGSFLDGSSMGKAALETLSLVASLTTPLIAMVIGYGTRLSWGSLGRPISDGCRPPGDLGSPGDRLRHCGGRWVAPSRPAPAGRRHDDGRPPAPLRHSAVRGAGFSLGRCPRRGDQHAVAGDRGDSRGLLAGGGRFRLRADRPR